MPARRRSSCGATVPKGRLAVPAVTVGGETRGPGPGGPAPPLHHDDGVRARATRRRRERAGPGRGRRRPRSYGGSANTTSKGRVGAGAAHPLLDGRPVDDSPGSATAPRFLVTTSAAARSRSTSATCDRASGQGLEPHGAGAGVEVEEAQPGQLHAATDRPADRGGEEENSPSRARSAVGRVPVGGTARRRPRAAPATIRVTRQLPTSSSRTASSEPSADRQVTLAGEQVRPRRRARAPPASRRARRAPSGPARPARRHRRRRARRGRSPKAG